MTSNPRNIEKSLENLADLHEKDLTPYEEIPQHMLPRDAPEGRDSDAAQAGQSDLERHQPDRLVVSDNDWYIEAVRQILASEEKGTSEALRANMRQFHEQVQDKTRLRKMEKRIWELEKALREANRSKGGGYSCPRLRGNFTCPIGNAKLCCLINSR